MKIIIAPTDGDRLVLTYQFIDQKETAIITLNKNPRPVAIPVSKIQWVDRSGTPVDKTDSTGYVVSIGDGAGASKIVQNRIDNSTINATYTVGENGATTLDRINSIDGQALSSDEAAMGLSGILNARHSMSTRSMYANEQVEVEECGHRRRPSRRCCPRCPRR